MTYTPGAHPYDPPAAGVLRRARHGDRQGGRQVDGRGIPPRHAALPGILGHELMHLFGLVDRYSWMTHAAPDGTRTPVANQLRDAGGRPDPPATRKAPMPSGDLSYVLDRFGVREMEERGLDTLRRLEAQGMSCTAVAVEISRQEEIVRLGRDPRSMIRSRTDFDDEMMRDAEQL